MPQRKPNRLIKEKSPYLLKHAYNPVDWHAWGEEAIDEAKQKDRPIFLSIGYSSCHWCSVMEKESFENDQIASILNERFVSIKVDREERPDIDEIYMKAVTTMAGQGGWPLSVFLTPDLKPFYGGTYFPPEPRHGLPSFPQVLEFIADIWRTKRDEVERNSAEITSLVRQSYETRPSGPISKMLLDNGHAVLVSSFDSESGGFGGAPKFPLPNYIGFLLRYYVRTRKESALKMAVKTLDSIAAGGIRDHIGGGFHRYSTDRRWLVPHFEKMLYDNSLLARVLLEAYQLTHEERYSQAARETLDWILREMTGPEGGFYSAEDADTPDGEGYYYTWTPDEVRAVLAEHSSAFNELYGVTADGNFEGGRSILHIAAPVERTASKLGVNVDELLAVGKESMPLLLNVRRKRRLPAIDDKVLASWNGLAISAFAYGYEALREEKYLEAAARSADFIIGRMVKNDTLYRRFRDGDVAIEGTLEDYSFLALGLVDLYEASFEERWLKKAVALAKLMVGRFWDAEAGGFLMTRSGEGIAKVKEGYDGPIPSGNSAATMALLKLAEFTGESEFRTKAETTMKLFSEPMEASPSSYMFMLCALDFWLGSREVVVVVGKDWKTAQDMVREVHSRFLPNTVSALVKDESSPPSPLTEGKVSLNGKATAYVCENFACRSPTTEIEALRKQLDA